MAVLSELDKVLTQLVEERKRVEQATREAHVVLKDFKGLLKEADKAEAKLKKLTADEFENILKPVLLELIDELSKQVSSTRDDLVRKLFKMFDELTNVLFTGDKKGRGLDLRDTLKQISAEQVEQDGD